MKTIKSVVCTVFEKNYHYGVGALANSLYAGGYRGILYTGYRGPLPPWVKDATIDTEGNTEFVVAPDLSIYFVPQDTDEMLANIKPDLIQQIWERYGDTIENVFYIDCDIIVKARWENMEEWARHGVALCEDMNSPVALTHPLRAQWREYYAKFGIDYQPRDNIYVNGGFVGINEKYQGFAKLWLELQNYMKQYTGKQHRIGIADRWNMFHFMDQDALNVAKDLIPEVSIIGKEAMDFGRFGHVMSHAAGPRKPWQTTYLKDIFLRGTRPSMSDKLYWHHVSHPIRLYSEQTVRRKRVALRVASLTGRFFTKV